MQVIIPTAPKFEQIVGWQKQTDGQRYRLMTYVVQQPVDDGLLLYNTLTCSLVLLTPDEATDPTGQQELIDHWFLVPQAHDDQKLCRQVRQMAALLKPAAKTIDSYTILTTTGCNARCFYYPQCLRHAMCFESCKCTLEKQQEHLYNTTEAMKNEYEIYLSKNEEDANHHTDSINV